MNPISEPNTSHGKSEVINVATNYSNIVNHQSNVATNVSSNIVKMETLHDDGNCKKKSKIEVELKLELDNVKIELRNTINELEKKK